MKIGNLKFEHNGHGGLKVSKLWDGNDDGVEYTQTLTKEQLEKLIPHVQAALPAKKEVKDEVKKDEKKEDHSFGVPEADEEVEKKPAKKGRW